MTKPTIFISDLHLSPADMATVDAFARFMASTARTADSLYILGDLFEYWLGDDQLAEPFYAEQVGHIAAVAASGVKVYFMAGNRDILPGKDFALAAQLQILPDPSIIHLNGSPILLAHGDRYCTDDLAYQRFRRITHNPVIQWLWLHLPRSIRTQQVAKLRAKSQQMNQSKAKAIMDVNSAAIEAELIRSGVATMIHGHTHRPARHEQQHGVRWVLPDWHAGQGGYLQLTDAGWELLTL